MYLTILHLRSKLVYPHSPGIANYTNIAVPAEYFNASMITVNNNPINASEFSEIRRADNSIWGYGARLTLDVGAQVIQHQDSDAALSVTMYGFSNQQSWGCTGGTGLAPVALCKLCASVVVCLVHDFILNRAYLFTVIQGCGHLLFTCNSRWLSL